MLKVRIFSDRENKSETKRRRKENQKMEKKESKVKGETIKKR